MWIKIGKFLWHHLLLGVLWVFILSITIDQKPLFFSAQDILVKNALVQTIDGELTTIWASITQSAKLTMNQMKKKKSQDSENNGQVVEQL